MTLLAGFQVLLHRYTGQDDIAVGAPIAGRTRAELEGLIGFFVNTLVLRADLSGRPELPRAARPGAGGGAGGLRPPGRAVREAGRASCAPSATSSRTPLFQVMFVLQNTPLPALQVAGAGARRRSLEGGVARSST